MVWYAHLSKNFLQFAVIHIVKGFSTANEAEVVVLLVIHCCLELKAICHFRLLILSCH